MIAVKRGAQTIACTIVARNYIAQARAWAESMRACAPDVRTFVLLVDEYFGAEWKEPELFEVLGIAEIGLPDLEAFVFRYDVTELSTAVKPWLLETLLDREKPAFLYYFDPDILFFRSPTELNDYLEDADVALTPHLLFEDAPRDRRVELAVLQSGTYNLGFFGMRDSNMGRRLLAWWRERLEFDCVSRVADGLFVDQKWINLVSGGMPRVAVIRDRGCNVAYWNIHQRTLRRADDGYFVDGAPLRFFHFSGYSPLAPDAVSKHRPDMTLQDRLDLRPLFYDYCERLFRAGYHRLAKIPYGFGFFSDGTPIPLVMRRVFREAERLYHDRWPYPRSTAGPGSFPIWALRDNPDSWLSPLGRHLLHERADLREAFPQAERDPAGPNGQAFRQWFRHHGASDCGIPESWFILADRQNGSPDGRESVAVPSCAAAGWLVRQTVTDDGLRKAWDEAEFLRAAKDAAARCSRPGLRAALENWLRTRPLERMSHWYALRTDLHEHFKQLWRLDDRSRFIRWLLDESKHSGAFGHDDVALLEIFLAGGAERAAFWVARHNSLARSWLVRRDIHAADPGLAECLEWRLSHTESVRPEEHPVERFGVNFVGYYDASSGVGEAARSTLVSARRAGIPMAVQNLPAQTSARTEYALRREPLSYGVTVFNVNADNLQEGWARLMAETLSDTHRIGVWFWELEDLPEKFLSSLDVVDEIWARSRFMERTFRRATSKPVHYLPLGIPEPKPPPNGCREHFGLRKEEFVFLASCDANSFLQRKNPWGVIDAFREARFPPGAARLVLRVNNLSGGIVRDLYERAAGASLLVLPGNWERSEQLRLMASADALVSLHRSEGFGLPMAEAMLLGKPVIATAYGGNMDFTTEETAFLVDYKLVPIGKKVGPYHASARWAEPNVSTAAVAMRTVASNRLLAQEKAARGGALLRRTHGLGAAGRAMRDLLEAAWKSWSQEGKPKGRLAVAESEHQRADRRWQRRETTCVAASSLDT